MFRATAATWMTIDVQNDMCVLTSTRHTTPETSVTSQGAWRVHCQARVRACSWTLTCHPSTCSGRAPSLRTRRPVRRRHRRRSSPSRRPSNAASLRRSPVQQNWAAQAKCLTCSRQNNSTCDNCTQCNKHSTRSHHAGIPVPWKRPVTPQFNLVRLTNGKTKRLSPVMPNRRKRAALAAMPRRPRNRSQSPSR